MFQSAFLERWSLLMRKADNYHPVIVLGATFAGIGTAYADRENTLIIERSALVGYEFINCFRTGTGWLDCKVSSEGERLRNELFEKNILKKDGKICISETAPVLYNRLVADNLNFLFMTDVVSIDSTSSAFEVEVYNASGFSRFIADKIIDTRPENIPPDQIQRKSINAILYSSGSTMFPDIHRPEAEFELDKRAQTENNTEYQVRYGIPGGGFFSKFSSKGINLALNLFSIEIFYCINQCLTVPVNQQNFVFINIYLPVRNNTGTLNDKCSFKGIQSIFPAAPEIFNIVYKFTITNSQVNLKFLFDFTAD